MNAILRNFLFVLKRFKTSSILNILGLSVAFAVFSVIIIHVNYDFSFDHSFKKSDSIYFFTRELPEDEQGATIPTPLAKEMSEIFPEIKSYCLLSYPEDAIFEVSSPNGIRSKFTEKFNKATVGLLNVFTPEIVAGNAHQALTDQNKAMISESTAHKFFGNNNPIGQTISLQTSKKLLTIVAVYKDFPENCSLNNGIYTQLPDDLQWNYNYAGYFEISPDDVNKLSEKINGKIKYGEMTWKHFHDPTYKAKAKFILLNKMYFYFHKMHLPYKITINAGSLTTSLSLLAIGILTLIIAYINFLNFSIAMVPARVRGLNIQKILGATPRKLKWCIAAEASIFSVISLLFALVLISFFKGYFINEYFTADLSLLKNWFILSLIGLSAILFGIIFGLYPANYATSFQPVVALSGSFSMSGRSVKLRNTLITFQFIFAISLTIISFFINKQHDYLQNRSWGIQKENVAYLPFEKVKTDVNTFGNELMKDPHILEYTASAFIPGELHMSWERPFEGKLINTWIWPVQSNFLHFFGVPIVEGRDFLESDSTGQHGMIFNQKVLKQYTLKNVIGKDITGFNTKYSIVGVAKNINYASLKDSIKPMAFVIMDNTWMKWFFIRISGKDTPATIESIKHTWKKYCDEDFDLKFLDTTLNELYKKESNLAKLISIFGLVIIVIAVMGVYGLIVFNARYKSKEIAIRKINGASVKEIILMLNRSILIQLVIAFVVAVPLAYYVVHRWLEQFPYKTPISWWVFALAGLLIFIITVVTVSLHSYKAAATNPVDAIKGE